MASGLRYGVEVRSAQPADAAEMVRLLAGFGQAGTVADMAERLEAIRLQANATALVATGYPGLSGLVSLSWAPQLLASSPVARITALVVDPEERRRGIGRLLLKAGSQAARVAGCHSIELEITGYSEAAEPFGLATGFAAHSQVFSRLLRKRS